MTEEEKKQEREKRWREDAKKEGPCHHCKYIRQLAIPCNNCGAP